ncbi:MAG: hypothetical protein A2X13_00230 [Bacteroidetes bacterium GWC2_33_15]|nr:MAG: hypothetical protein A2X10_04040 [Bacteroidetes bacterium GWA2_33_15]OFX51053.1 MAG: hypothetical protein A2X13_00230 [Bacteroidetes bacterium GWC2_33_15]OFX65676.1 MAG: hypothetical protein A2X15_13850 [Bacteroidetes bacterium GWB2_32_14]OFX70261.1 MAG: hypothetical protein A2X14_03120 [Bacteroidetes bacterium GWD2_33_33]HAN17257.1 hypothetical protein [Bacteroidales bacterium]
MFNLFKKKKRKIQLKDLNGNPLNVGDKVESLRYELGICTLIESENGFEYQSESTGQKVSYAKMIDAATTFQKVKKLD